MFFFDVDHGAGAEGEVDDFGGVAGASVEGGLPDEDSLGGDKTVVGDDEEAEEEEGCADHDAQGPGEAIGDGKNKDGNEEGRDEDADGDVALVMVDESLGRGPHIAQGLLSLSVLAEELGDL